MRLLLLACAGGALGSGARYLTYVGVGRWVGIASPYAAAFATLGGAGAFAAAALALAAVGVTPYLFLYIRSSQHPIINEADPSTLDALLAVIRRAQYPPRTPLDDPTELHGPENPGRTLTLIGWQLASLLLAEVPIGDALTQLMALPAQGLAYLTQTLPESRWVVDFLLRVRTQLMWLLLVAVLIMEVFIYRIKENFDSIEVGKMGELKG